MKLFPFLVGLVCKSQYHLGGVTLAGMTGQANPLKDAAPATLASLLEETQYEADHK